MKRNLWFRLFKLIFGLFLHGVGIVMQIQANIGYAPWDVLHAGLAKTLGYSFGQVVIGLGLIILVIDILLKEPLGIGTIANMILVGYFVDLVMSTGLIPQMNSFATGLPMLILGMSVLSTGVYFYIGSAFGAGPRDTLMVALNRRLGIPIGAARSILELMAVLGGRALGGMVGIGTLLAAIFIGFIMQGLFRLLRFEPKDVVHQTFFQPSK